MTLFRTILLATALGLGAGAAGANPPEPDETRETTRELIQRMLRNTEAERAELAERGRDAAEEAGTAVIDSDLAETMTGLLQALSDNVDLEGLAQDAERTLSDSELVARLDTLAGELAERIEIERGEGGGTALRWDDEDVLRIRRQLDRSVDDQVTISGLGRNLTVERETVTRDGETKTRIVIEMEGGTDVEIDLPSGPASDQE